MGRYPIRFILDRNFSSLLWSVADAKPHQAGAAYNNLATVVASETVCNAFGGRPCDLSIFKACRESEQAPIRVHFNLKMTHRSKITGNRYTMNRKLLVIVFIVIVIIE